MTISLVRSIVPSLPAFVATVSTLYRCRNDKKKFREYVEGHEECRHLDEESCWIIGRFTNAEKLLTKSDKNKKEKDMDIGSAIWDIREEGVQEGISQGIIETCKEFGCSKEEIVLKLMKKLSMSAGPVPAEDRGAAGRGSGPGVHRRQGVPGGPAAGGPPPYPPPAGPPCRPRRRRRPAYAPPRSAAPRSVPARGR